MLRLENISKSFPGVKALQDVTLQFGSGVIHALCGENGAGKSTLMNIIMGNLQPDMGKIFWKDHPVEIKSVLAAQSLGISIVYQERSLVDGLSIAENIFPVNMPVTTAGIIDFRELLARTRELLDQLGMTSLAPKTIVNKLSASQKQMVEIAKAIAQKPSLLILDEPTASLTHTESEILFEILLKLRDNGVAIIYISHRMGEIQQIANIVSVLKDGKLVGTVTSDTAPQEIIRMMVGRELESLQYTSHVKEKIIFEARNISGKGFYNLNFQLHQGEVLGFAGLQGSGRTEMAKALFGDRNLQHGRIFKTGKHIRIRHPAQAIHHRVVYLPEDRKTDGLFLHRSVAENIFAADLNKGFYHEVIVDSKSSELCTIFGIRTPTVKQQMKKLSGGNQQKAMIAKWVRLQPDLLIVNEPTHGVDVGSKLEIYQLLKRMTEEGKSILLISSELTELLILCDRIAVMYEGRIQGILNRAEATEEKITALASGIIAD